MKRFLHTYTHTHTSSNLTWRSNSHRTLLLCRGSCSAEVYQEWSIYITFAEYDLFHLYPQIICSLCIRYVDYQPPLLRKHYSYVLNQSWALPTATSDTSLKKSTFNSDTARIFKLFTVQCNSLLHCTVNNLKMRAVSELKVIFFYTGVGSRCRKCPALISSIGALGGYRLG